MELRGFEVHFLGLLMLKALSVRMHRAGCVFIEVQGSGDNGEFGSVNGVYFRL